MKISWKEDRYAIISMAFFTLIMFMIALLTHGTCDEGDSIMHYLFARYAFAHPENFFNHWAKPFYVLIMSPFASFGFLGAKLWNTALSCIAVWFTYLIARELKYKWALSVFPISLFFKTFLIVSLSGLTEPLNNAMISVALYLAFTRRYAWSAVIMSFLPFVRSEGLFLCGAFSLYLIWMRQWRSIPLLLIGHVVYSIAGYHIYHDFFWVFNQIPYAHADTHYGHGRWLTFVIQMPVIAGMVNAILILLGVCITLASSVYYLYHRQWKQIPVATVFITFLFLVFFCMHTTFWALGIFGSFGLIRVFIAIHCVMAIIVVYALDNIDLYISRWLTRHTLVLSLSLLVLSLIFALVKLPCAYDRRHDFVLHADEICDIQVAAFVNKNYPDHKNYQFFFDACYLAEVLDIDYFDAQRFHTNEHLNPLEPYPPHSIIIWDDWYSRFEHGVDIKQLQSNRLLKQVKVFTHDFYWGETRTVVLFVREN